MFIRDNKERSVPTIYLEDIADKLDEVSEGWDQYLNMVTSTFELLSNGMYAEVDETLAERIASTGYYLRLPSQHEIHEYHIMAAFAAAISDTKKQDRLFAALCGNNPFRRFKNALTFLGTTGAYYSFRYQKYLELAKEWCETNHISYLTRGLQ